MFKVIRKEDAKPFTVYNIRIDSTSYLHLLIYDNNAWAWVSAKHFTPCVEDIIDKLNEIGCTSFGDCGWITQNN